MTMLDFWWMYLFVLICSCVCYIYTETSSQRGREWHLSDDLA